MPDRSPDAIYRPCHPLDALTRFADMDARGNGLRVSCWDCRHSVDISGSALVDTYGPDVTIEQFWPKLTCSACKVGRVHVYQIGMGVSRHPGPVRYREGMED